MKKIVRTDDVLMTFFHLQKTYQTLIFECKHKLQLQFPRQKGHNSATSSSDKSGYLSRKINPLKNSIQHRQIMINTSKRGVTIV